MIRLHFIVEGHAEEGFVKRVLVQEFASHNIFIDVRRVLTGRKGNIKFRGGLTNYEKLRNDILLWMKEDTHSESRFTSMIDYYGLPTNFPGLSDCLSLATAFDKVKCLETNFANDIQNAMDMSGSLARFVPNIQLHEFETLLFSDIECFPRRFPCQHDELAELRSALIEFGHPEEINGGDHTHPSVRIRQAVRRYDKRADGIELASMIGLPAMRQKCPHFNSWIETLLQLR